MRRMLVALLLLTLVPIPAAFARGGTGEPNHQAQVSDFRFYGSGFGHGLGMSQWGAFGLARRGWSAPRILTHYYSGTRVAEVPPPVDRLRVGLVQSVPSVRLEAQLGDVELHLGDRTGDLIATVPAGRTWRVRVSGDRYRIIDGDGGTVADVGGPETPIVAVFEPQGAHLRVPEAGHTYARGWIEFGLYNCTSGCAMRLVLLIGSEEYLYGLGEVPSSWPTPALAAQAIAARTYAYTKALASQHRAVCDCALYASSFDQVYVGWDKEAGVDGDRWVGAVDGTRNEVVRDGGDTIQAFYMSSSGGFTEDNENVWGGEPLDYLRGVCDPGDYTVDNPSATWVVTVPAQHVTRALSLGIGTVTGFADAQRGVSGRIISITVRGENGSASISGATLRSSLELRDDRVWIDRNRQITDQIRAKYDGLGCSPGLATSRQVAVAGGLRQAFEHGTIYFLEGVGAHELHDPVLAFYVRKGGAGGRLGFPTSDVRRLPNGNLRVSFQHGTITCTSSACRIG